MYISLIIVILLILYLYNKSPKVGSNVAQKTNLEMLIQKNNQDVKQNSENPSKVKELREQLEKDIDLSKKLYYFFDEVRHYPYWYQHHKNEDGTPMWKSSALKPEELSLLKFSESHLKNCDVKDFRDDKEFFQYKFTLGNDTYFLTLPTDSLIGGNYIRSEDDDHYYPAYVIKDNKILFKSDLHFTIDEYSNYYSRCRLEIFKPDKWAIHLIDIFEKVKDEAARNTKIFWEKMKKQDEEKIKKNFL